MYLFGLGVRKFEMELEFNWRWWVIFGCVWYFGWCWESLYEDFFFWLIGVKIRLIFYIFFY